MIINPYVFSGFDAEAVAFDGSTYIRGNTWGSGTSADFFMSFWIRTTDAGLFILAQTQKNGRQPKEIKIDNGKLAIQLLDTSGSVVVSSASTVSLNDGNWHHVAISLRLSSTSTRGVYIDGAEDTSQTWTTYSTTGQIDHDGVGYIGANSSGGENFTGDLAEFIAGDSYYGELSTTAYLRQFINGVRPANPEALTDDYRTILSGDASTFRDNTLGTLSAYTFTSGTLTDSTNEPVEL